MLWLSGYATLRRRKSSKQDPSNEAYLSDEGYLVRAATRPCAAHGGFAAGSGGGLAARGYGELEHVWLRRVANSARGK